MNLKKNRRLVLMMVLTMVAFATKGMGQQKMEVTIHQEGREVEEKFMREASWIGASTDGVLLYGEGKKHRGCLIKIDKESAIQKRIDYPEESAKSRLLTGSMHGGVAGMIIASEEGRDEVVVYSSAIETSSLLPYGEGEVMRVVDTIKLGKKDKCYLWAASSNDGRYKAVMEVVEYGKEKQYTAKAILFDHCMREEWRKECEVGMIDFLAVSDEGEVVAMGYETGIAGIAVAYTVIKDERVRIYKSEVNCPRVRQIEMAGFAGRYLMAAGLYMAEGTDEDDNMCGGVLGLAFNIDTMAITGVAEHDFQSEDINILTNKKTKKKQKGHKAEWVSMLGCVPTGYGAVIAAGCNFEKNWVEDNGNTGRSYHRIGIHVVGIDTTGHIRWARNIRRNDMQKKSQELLNVCLVGAGDDAIILKSEQKGYPTIYDISKAAREYNISKKGNTVAYKIDANGEVEKEILEPKTRFKTIRAGRTDEGQILLFTQKGKHNRFLELQK